QTTEFINYKKKRIVELQCAFNNHPNQLFTYYFKFKFQNIFFAKVDLSFVRTGFLNFINNADSAAIDFIAFLFTNSTSNLNSRNGSKYFSAFTDFSTNLNRASFQGFANFCYLSQ